MDTSVDGPERALSPTLPESAPEQAGRELDVEEPTPRESPSPVQPDESAIDNSTALNATPAHTDAVGAPRDAISAAEEEHCATSASLRTVSNGHDCADHQEQSNVQEEEQFGGPEDKELVDEQQQGNEPLTAAADSVPWPQLLLRPPSAALPKPSSAAESLPPPTCAVAGASAP